MKTTTDFAFPAKTRLPETRLFLPGGFAEVYRHASDVPAAFWKPFNGSPKDRPYYQLLELSMREHFDYRYLAVYREDDTPMALQPIVITTQDLVASAGPALTRFVAALRKRWPGFLRTRTLMAGCLVGEGSTGFIDAPRVAMPMVAQAFRSLARYERISLLVFKDFPAAWRDALGCLQSFGYTRLPGFPSLALDFQFPSFTSYEAQLLSRATRKSLRRKLRATDAVKPPVTLEVWETAEEIIDEVYPLYLAVAKRSDVQFEIFTPEYFVRAARLMPGRFRFFVWRQHGRAVAFSFCTIWDGTIYDNDIGFDYSVSHDLNLYYVTFRDLVCWALKNGLRRYASSPFNYAPKLQLRLGLQPVDIYVQHTSRFLNSFIEPIAPFFAPARTDPVLRKNLARLV